MAGAVPVPIYETSSAEQIEWIGTDSGAVGIFLETPAHQASYDEVSGSLRDVRHVWSIEGGAIDELVAGGKHVSEDDIEQRRRTLTAQSLATIIYTSGTTGRPKGCELSHGNLLFDVTATGECLDEMFGPDQSTLLFLPLAHVFARLIEIGCVQNRVRMGHTADMKNLVADLGVFKPTFVLSVPRVFEKVYNTAKQRAHADGKGAIFDLAESVAIGYSEALDGNLVKRAALEVPHRVFDALVYSKLRGALGGRATSAISGGAPLGPRLGHFYRGCGIPIYEGYGLTETAAGHTVNRPGAMRVGTVGQPIPGCTVRIADDGEILLRGANVFTGYHDNKKATDEAIEREGWFHSGDIGELDADGYLTITGRKKELIVTAGGKNVAPAVLEDRLRAHSLISQMPGRRRPEAFHRRARHDRRRSVPRLEDRPRQAGGGDRRRPRRRPRTARRPPGGDRRHQQGGVEGGGDQGIPDPAGRLDDRERLPHPVVEGEAQRRLADYADDVAAIYSGRKPS